MNSERLSYLKTVRFVCYVALAAIFVYFGRNVLAFYSDLKAVSYVPSGITDSTPAQQKQPERPPLEKYKPILDRNLFLVAVDLEKPVDTKNLLHTIDNLPRTSLDCILLGTMIRDKGRSQAIIEDQKTRRQDKYRVGSTVCGAKVVMILRKKVVLNVDGKDQVLLMGREPASPDKPGFPPPLMTSTENRPMAEPNWEERSSLGYAQIMLKVRLKPYLERGNQEGFEVKSIADGSPLKPMGLRDGDIIKKFNGQPLDSDEDIVEIHNAIDKGLPFTISLVRNGRPMTLSK